MKIIWNKVTRLSQLVAIVLFVGVFFVGIVFGRQMGVKSVLGQSIKDAVFQCDEGKSIHAVFYERAVRIGLPEDPEVFLMSIISGSGARYANTDESFVFWNKGDEALIMRDNEMDLGFKNCKIK